MPMMGLPHSQSTPPVPPHRRAWLAPRVDDMPRLTELTLQTTGIPGDCDPGDPSSCF